MTSPAPRISFVSLGCPKALVDSERIITRLRAEGYELTKNHEGADAVIVNTCGFLDSAKAESLDAIGKALSENGKVIVTGCMGGEPEQSREAYPSVASITGPQAYESVLKAVTQLRFSHVSRLHNEKLNSISSSLVLLSTLLRILSLKFHTGSHPFFFIFTNT